MLNRKERRQLIKKNMFTPNTNNLDLINRINTLSPSFGKHMVEKGSLVEMLLKYNISNIPPADLIMCPKCERIAMPHGSDSCYCEKCGISKSTKTFGEYYAEDIKELANDPEIAILINDISLEDIQNYISEMEALSNDTSINT